MRFIAEFEIHSNIDHKLLPHIIPDKRHIRELCIGRGIGAAFGWDETPQSNNTMKYSLEIEAFPMDKWVEFKQKVSNVLGHGSREEHELFYLIKELESYGQKGEPAAR